MRFRDFDTDASEATDEPVEFRLGGETFACVPVLPFGQWVAYVRTGDPYVLLDAAVVDEDLERLHKLLDRKSDAVSGDRVGDLISWLAEVYTGRPTKRPSNSSDGPLPTGPSSTDD